MRDSLFWANHWCVTLSGSTQVSTFSPRRRSERRLKAVGRQWPEIPALQKTTVSRWTRLERLVALDELVVVNDNLIVTIRTRAVVWWTRSACKIQKHRCQRDNNKISCIYRRAINKTQTSKKMEGVKWSYECLDCHRQIQVNRSCNSSRELTVLFSYSILVIYKMNGTFKSLAIILSLVRQTPDRYFYIIIIIIIVLFQTFFGYRSKTHAMFSNTVTSLSRDLLGMRLTWPDDDNFADRISQESGTELSLLRVCTCKCKTMNCYWVVLYSEYCPLLLIQFFILSSNINTQSLTYLSSVKVEAMQCRTVIR